MVNCFVEDKIRSILAKKSGHSCYIHALKCCAWQWVEKLSGTSKALYHLRWSASIPTAPCFGYEILSWSVINTQYRICTMNKNINIQACFYPETTTFLLSDLQTSPADIHNIISRNNHRDEMLSGVNRRGKTTQQVNVCVRACVHACSNKKVTFFQVWRRHADRLAHWNVLKSQRVSRGRSDWEQMSSEPQFCGQNALLMPEVRGEWPGWCEMTERQTQR